MEIDFIDVCIIFVTIILCLFVTYLLIDNILGAFTCGIITNSLAATLVLNKHLYEQVNKIAE